MYLLSNSYSALARRESLCDTGDSEQLPAQGHWAGGLGVKPRLDSEAGVLDVPESYLL